MVWRGLNGVPRAVLVTEALLPGPGKLGANRIGIFPPAFRPGGDQPLRALMTPDDHVLPQARVFIGVRGITEVGTEVCFHAQKVAAVTGRAGGADFPSKSLKIVEAEHQSIFAQICPLMQKRTSVTSAKLSA